MIYPVEVDVSLGRPPRADATIYYQVAADSAVDAQLIACQMAACHPRVTMPVASRSARLVVGYRVIESRKEK